MTTTIEHGITLASTVADALVRDDGVRSHAVDSPYQHEPTAIHVIPPEVVDEPATVLFVLPVAPHGAQPWGDPVAECLACDLANRHGIVCVVPTFSNMPWYGNHPTDPRMRQETYVLEVVLPFVELAYPVRRDAAGRRLVGFSKSGWGAWTLLLRYPELFGRAVAWDAPLGQQSPNKYGMSEVFATQASLDPYCVWDLLATRADTLAESTDASPRFGLFGYGSFRAHHQATHHHMLRLGIPHEYVDGPHREHDWHSGWLEEAAEFAVA